MITGSSGFRVCDGGAVGASWLVVKKITEDASRPVREFSRFDGDALLGLDSLGLRGVAQRHLPEGGRGGVWEVRYEPVEPARVCRDCGVPAPVRSSRWRRFVHVLLGKAGVRLLVRCRRYECRGCGGAWEDDLSRVAADGRRLTERAAWWAVASVVLDAMSVRSVAATLGCLWDCANDAVPAKGMKHLAGDEHRLDGVTHLGVDEHVWRHTSRGSRYVTVVVDLTPRRDGRPARLLDVVEGRSGAAFAGWLASRSEEFRRNVRVVAMDAFAGYKHAVRKAVPHAREVLDPFHVVRLAGDKLRLAAYYRDAFRGGWRMWARLRGVLARVGRWFLSPAGRAVWVRLLLFGASIPLAPYMVAVWRVAPYGQGAEQCLLFVAVAGALLFRGGWRRLHALRAARDKDRQSDPDRARKPVRPARNRARRR